MNRQRWTRGISAAAIASFALFGVACEVDNGIAPGQEVDDMAPVDDGFEDDLGDG